MFVSKQTIAVSSDTANWTGKRAAQGIAFNGTLSEVHIGPGASTDKAVSLYRGTTELGNLIMKVIPGTTSYTWRPRGRLTENSTAAPTVSSTGSVRFPWLFADEVPSVVCGGTCKSFNLSLYVEGVTSSG